MSSISENHGLHEQDTDDDEAAKYHRKAPEFYDQNKVSDAKGSSKSAMDSRNTSHQHSTTTQKRSTSQIPSYWK